MLLCAYFDATEKFCQTKTTKREHFYRLCTYYDGKVMFSDCLSTYRGLPPGPIHGPVTSHVPDPVWGIPLVLSMVLTLILSGVPTGPGIPLDRIEFIHWKR